MKITLHEPSGTSVGIIEEVVIDLKDERLGPDYTVHVRWEDGERDRYDIEPGDLKVTVVALERPQSSEES